MMEKNMSGEVFYPIKEIMDKAYVKNWDEMDKRAQADLEGFWAEEAKTCIGLKNGARFWMNLKSRFINGLRAARPISPTIASMFT